MDLGAEIEDRSKKMKRCRTEEDLGNLGFVKSLSFPQFESYAAFSSFTLEFRPSHESQGSQMAASRTSHMLVRLSA